MKMKKLFMVLIVAVLILSLVSGVSAEKNPVTVYNKTVSEATGNKVPVSVNITLSLSNDYTVEIPADFSLTTVDIGTNDKMYTTPRSSGYPIIDVHVLLLGEGEFINVTVNPAEDKYYNDTYTAAFSHSSYNKGAWKFNSSTGGHELHYLITNTTFITADGYNGDGKLRVAVSESDNFVEKGESIVYTNVPVKVPIHVAVIEKPSAVSTYESKLTFTVQLDS